MPVNTYPEKLIFQLKEILLFLVFSNIYIVLCSIIMAYHTAGLFSIKPVPYTMLFMASGTLTSYSFHWMLPPAHKELSPRDIWSRKHRLFLFILFAAGAAISVYSMFVLREHFLKLVPLIVLTFLYSSGRLPKGPFIYLRKYFIGKTIYLSLMWSLVTVYLPLALSDTQWSYVHYLFFSGRFFFLFAICILFDLRDKEADALQGIKSLITLLSYNSIKLIFYFSLLLSIVCSLLMHNEGTALYEIIILIIPAALAAVSYSKSAGTRSDLWFYFYLDGLMMLSGILSLAVYK